MKTNALFILICLIVALALAACSPAAPSQPALSGSWDLVNMAGKPVSGITITFDAEKIRGSAGCNSYFGEFTLEGDRFTVGMLGATAMYCEDEERMQHESEFLIALSAAEQISVTTDQIIIHSTSGELVFQPEAVTPDHSLAGSWKLETFILGETAHSTLAGSEIRLELSDGSANGNSGCNGFFGSYEVENDHISFSSLGSTMMACDENLMRQETEFLTALQQISSFRTSGNTLTLDYADGALQFTLTTYAE